jgi:HD-like signal output (HDOD) protein
MKRVLFVDDEPAVLSGLRRLLHAERAALECTFTSSAKDALRLLQESDFDVIVADARMPEMDGARLLCEVQRRHPEVVRIILSGQADEALILRSVGPAHQYLAKPCQSEEVRSVIQRACAVQERLRAPTLRALASRMGSLPSLPALYNELLREVQSSDGTAESVGRIIAQDVAMTAKVLQVVNSAFFGLRQRACDPASAVRFLGFDTLRSLALSAQVFSMYEGERSQQLMGTIWEHSIRTAACAASIAREVLVNPLEVEQALCAGMLHDVGVLLLLEEDTERYETLLLHALAHHWTDTGPAEERLWGGTHSEIGAYLLDIWGLPGAVVESVAFHHRPDLLGLERPTVATCVAAASALTAGDHGGPHSPIGAHLAALGLGERFEGWRAFLTNQELHAEKAQHS